MENVIDSTNFFEGNDEVELFVRSDSSKSKSSKVAKKVGKEIGKSVGKKTTKSGGKAGLIIGIAIVIIIIIIILIVLKSKNKKNKGNNNDKPPKVEEEEPENIVVENEGKPYPAEGESNVVTPPPTSNAPNSDASQSPYQPLQYPQGTYPPQAPVGQYQPMQYPPTIQYPCGMPSATMPPMTEGGYLPQGYNTTSPLPNTTQPPLGTVTPNLTNFASTEAVPAESINAMPQLK